MNESAERSGPTPIGRYARNMLLFVQKLFPENADVDAMLLSEILEHQDLPESVAKLMRIFSSEPKTTLADLRWHLSSIERNQNQLKTEDKGAVFVDTVMIEVQSAIETVIIERPREPETTEEPWHPDLTPYYGWLREVEVDLNKILRERLAQISKEGNITTATAAFSSAAKAVRYTGQFLSTAKESLRLTTRNPTIKEIEDLIEADTRLHPEDTAQKEALDSILDKCYEIAASLLLEVETQLDKAIAAKMEEHGFIETVDVVGMYMLNTLRERVPAIRAKDTDEQ